MPIDHFAFIDLETVGTKLDDQIVEIGCIITDMNLTTVATFEILVHPGRQALLRMTDDDNEIVWDMHHESGLYDAMLSSTVTPAEAELEFHEFLERNTTKGNVSIAGSGVARFDLGMIEHQYRLFLGDWFTYFAYDIGVVRRYLTWANGGVSVIPPVKASFVDGEKAHRAMADAKAHLEEFKAYAAWTEEAVHAMNAVALRNS